MARLATLGKGEWDQFDRVLSGTDLSAEEVRKLLRHPQVLADMLTAMRQHPTFRLIHGRFTPLAEKLEVVKRYPGVTEADITAALETARSSGRLARYEEASPENSLLDVVVTVYRASVPETLLYARDRMRDTFGDAFAQWEDVYGQNVDENRVRLLEGVPDHQNCVRIEVVDLGAHWDPKNGFIPKGVRSVKSATFAAIYAVAQNSEWFRQMDGKTVPYALVGGLELNVPGNDLWADLPNVWHNGARAKLDGNWLGARYRGSALPCLWE